MLAGIVAGIAVVVFGVTRPIGSLVGILQHEDHGTVQLSGYGGEEERCR